MTPDIDDTIVAVASAPGGALRGIVRLSGPQSMGVLQPWFIYEGDELSGAKRFAHCVRGQMVLPAPWGRVPVDAYLWPTERSYTKQPAAEIHTFGSPPLLDAVVGRLCEAGARLANPGEFTMRAFLAGRIDLTQAEAVLGVIDARGEHDLQTALAQLAGGLAAPLGELRVRLLELLAHLEAGLDFVEEDIEFITAAALQQQLEAAHRQITSLLQQMETRAESAHELCIVLRGLTNVGKSSLLNALAEQPVAIVSNIAGTTRDYVTRTTTIHGVACQLVDTAGVESARQPLAAAAQQVTSRMHQAALLELFCIDARREPTPWEIEVLGRLPASSIVVLTKVDLLSSPVDARARIESLSTRLPVSRIVCTSSKTGAGLEQLREAIAERTEAAAGTSQQVVVQTANRCRESLRLAAASLKRAQEVAQAGWGEELVAAELHVALDELGQVVGATSTDDILDRIFSRFCIGK